MVVSFDATWAAVFHHHLASCIHFNCSSKNKVPQYFPSIYFPYWNTSERRYIMLLSPTFSLIFIVSALFEF